MTFIRQHLYNVFVIRRIHDVEIRIFCIPHAETIMMPRNKCNIFHTGILCHAHPFGRIKFNGVKKILQSCIIFYSDMFLTCITHSPEPGMLNGPQ